MGLYTILPLLIMFDLFEASVIPTLILFDVLDDTQVSRMFLHCVFGNRCAQCGQADSLLCSVCAAIFARSPIRAPMGGHGVRPSALTSKSRCWWHQQSLSHVLGSGP